MKATKGAIISALHKAGVTDVGLWYDRSARQWTFTGAGVYEPDQWFTTGTCIYALDQLTVSGWVDLAIELSKDTI